MKPYLPNRPDLGQKTNSSVAAAQQYMLTVVNANTGFFI
jgi:hypothetical protein